MRMIGVGVSPSERASWANSLRVLSQDLLDAGLGEVEVIAEYQLPLSSKRADVVLAGVHPHTGHDSYVVIELKQWSSASAYDQTSELVTVGGASGLRLHPGAQVRQYCEYICGYVAALDGTRDALQGAAYLHNATDESVRELFRAQPTESSRIFTGQRRGELMSYLQSRLAPKSGSAAADRLLTSAIRPSRHLLDHASGILHHRDQFTLLDQQRVAYDLVLKSVDLVRASDNKTVVVITGGPGTGKSVIALSVLAEMARRGYPALHATGSRSFTQTLRKYAGKGSTKTQSLFKYFNNFMEAKRNDIDVLICDEAHRIRSTSVNRYTKSELRSHGRPQVDELIAAARVPVFLLDEHQVVRPGETGTVEMIRSHAARLGVEVEVVPLHGQFRLGGSLAYESWVLGFLGLDGSPVPTWTGDGLVDIRVAESPDEMETFLAARQSMGETARMSAGFCWPWSDPRADGSLVSDVKIGNWERPWNVKGDRAVGEAPASAFWATDPSGFGQVGCVFTAQGFEYEWSGVILGPDLVARDGRIVTRRSESHDPELRKRTAVHDDDADKLIRNAYKVLLTRGMRGTMIYSVDEETRNFLRTHVRPDHALEIRYEPASPSVSPRTSVGAGVDSQLR